MDLGESVKNLNGIGVKKAAALDADDLPDELEADSCTAGADADEASFEVSAQDVIANPESME